MGKSSPCPETILVHGCRKCEVRALCRNHVHGCILHFGARAFSSSRSGTGYEFSPGNLIGVVNESQVDSTTSYNQDRTLVMIEDYFSIQIFFIILRETLETAIIVSVLLSFINQRSHGDNANPNVQEAGASDTITTSTFQQQKHDQFIKSQKLMKLQVWLGAIMGLFICMVIGLVFILSFYFIGKDYWSYTERLWEGVFSVLSSIIITIMGIGLLRINKVMKVKWWMKLGDAYNQEDPSKLTVDDADYGSGQGQEDVASAVISPAKPRKSFTKKYFLAILPFVTTLREGLEAVVFIGGIGMSHPPSSLPLSIISGMVCGSSIGYFLYRGGNKLSLQYFLILSTCFLYIISAGLMSRGVWFLELEKYVRLCGGMDVSETGSGPGSYDISTSVWHVNCCNGLKDGWWMVFNAIFGWTNSATYGSVGSYMAYWVLVIVWLEIKLYEEKQGYLPVIPVLWQLKRIRKKVRLYETRYTQNERLDNLNDSFQEHDSSVEEREAEAQVLLL